MSIEKTIWPGSTQLAPSPVVLVGTGDGKRRPWDIMTAAWAGTLSSDPPMVGIGVRPSRFTYDQIEALQCFTLNMPTAAQARAVDYCGVISGRDTDKFSTQGLTALKASRIVAPIVEECPVSLECEVKHRLDLGSHVLYIGQVVAVQVTSSLIDDKGRLDLAKADLLAYAHGHYYSLGADLGHFGYPVKKK
ncbi:MAG: flavin reductase family protein [Lentisphaeria bacterium]|nr:flavin reductase family protein [Lentisphaeria bacterium]